MDEEELQLKPSTLLILEESGYAENVIDVGNVLFGKITDSEISSWPQKKKQLVLGEGFKERPLKEKDLYRIWRERQEGQIANLTRAACALLNSGGGVIRAEIENEDYCFQEREIGTIIENSLRKLIQDRKADLFFDYEQKGPHMLIFVKTWSNENAFPRLCSLTTGLYERSGTSTVKTQPKNATELLRRKKSSAKRSPPEEGRLEPKRLCFNEDPEESSQESIQENAAEAFFRRERLELGESLNFTESNTVEFKSIKKPEKDTMDFVRGLLPKYVSAFANADGGYLFFGVEDSLEVTGSVNGLDPDQFRTEFGAIIGNMPRYHFCGSENKIVFEFKALPVQDAAGESHGYIFAIRIEPFSGVVFQSGPDSWIVDGGRVKRLTVPQWIELMAAEDPDLSKLANGFTRVLSLSDGPPMVKPVYSVSDLESLQESLFPADPNRIAFISKGLCEQLFHEYPELRDLMERKGLPHGKGTLMFSRSWAVDIGLPKNGDVVCDALLIADGRHVQLLTVTKAAATDVYGHARRTARELKRKLVNIGGFSHKIGLIVRILCLDGDAGPVEEQVWYPQTYKLESQVLSALQKAVVIVLLTFTSSLSDFLGVHFLNLLTVKQFESISKNLRRTPQQFIYGLPGSGKTVVALRILEKIRNEFDCHPDEILYVCENQPLRDFVRGRTAFQAVTRTSFMNPGQDFSPVKHIVIDEAQNFRTEDGPWYQKATNIVQRGDPGVLWIFLDYFQMNHPYDTGLPQRQYPQEWLTRVIRNATRIYAMVKREMERIVENPKLWLPHRVLRALLHAAECGHDKPGVCETHTERSWPEVARYVAVKCRDLLERGYSQKDIAILCSTRETADTFNSILSEEIRRNPQLRKSRLNWCFVKADQILQEKIVLDSVRRFSGLERPIVFGINPYFIQKEVSHNLLLSLYSRAILHLYLVYLENRHI